MCRGYHIIDEIKVTGTKSYQSLTGIRTVKIISLTPLEEQRENARIERETSLSDFVLKDGTTIRGEFVKMEKGLLKIIDADGNPKSIKTSEVTPETLKTIRTTAKVQSHIEKFKPK